jgi:cytochrome c
MLRLMKAVSALLAAFVAVAGAEAQELRGHGGPVRAVAVSPDGALAATGSFDQSVILWRLQQGAAVAVLRFHEGAVNAVIALPDGQFASGGEDGRIALWRPGLPEPVRIIGGHEGQVSALAVSADGRLLASASWDATVRVTPLADGAVQKLEGHRGPVSGVAFAPDGAVVSVGQDATLRWWPARGDGSPKVLQMEAPLNAVTVNGAGEAAVSGADGRVRFVSQGTGVEPLRIAGEVAVGEAPLIALARSTDGGMLAAGGVRGAVALIDWNRRSIRATLTGPGLPVWSLGFTPDGRELLTGGADRIVRRWSALTGEHIGPVVARAAPDVLAPFQGERGAQVFRACAACHTLTADGGNRAGPTLHGVMGRRIGTAEGYNFSPALRGMDIVWTKETIARLFEIGPNAYTPGTKMPEQVIISADDRRALVEWLDKVTR